MNVQRTVVIVSIAVIYVLYIPLTLHFLRNFLRYKKEVVIVKRHPNIVFAFSVFGLIYLAVTIPLCILVTLSITTKPHDATAIFLDSFVTSPVESFTFYPVLLLIFIKYWLIFLDIKRIQYSFNFEWKTLINPYFYLMNEQTLATAKTLSRSTSISSFIGKDTALPKHVVHQQKFWSARKSTPGHEKKMMKLTLMISFILSTISATCWIIFDGLMSYEIVATIFDFTILFATFCGIFILNMKAPKMMDKLHIRDEVAYVASCLVWPIIVYLIAFSIVSDVFWNKIITSHISCSAVFILLTFQLKFVFIKCGHLIQSGKNKDSQRQIVVSSMSSSKSLMDSSDSQSCSVSVSISRSLQIIQGAKKGNSHSSSSPSVSGSATAVERLEKMRKVSQEITFMSQKTKQVIEALDWLHNQKDKDGKRISDAKLTNVLPNVVDDQTVTLKRTTSLAKILKNQRYLEQLMHHLSLEFSMEIILGFIEFSQFLELLVSKLKNDPADSDHDGDAHLHKDDEDQAESSIVSDWINLLELNDEILSNPDYTAFYSFVDSVLFDEKDIDLSKIKIFEFPDTVPTSFIIFNNLYNIANVVNDRVSPASVTHTNPFDVINRPMLVLQSHNDFDENEKRMKLLYESISVLLLQLSSFYSIGYELYTKYVKRGSEFELSINSYLKERFFEIFDEFNFLKFINNFSQQPDLTSDFDFEMNAKMRSKTRRMRYQCEIAIENDILPHASNNDNYNTAMQASHKDNVTFLFNPQKRTKPENPTESDTLSYTKSKSKTKNNSTTTSANNNNGDQLLSVPNGQDDESFAPSTTFNSSRFSEPTQITNESDNSASSSEIIRQKTENLLIEKLSIHDLSWLLLKKKFNYDHDTVEQIHDQLRNNVFAFLLLISKLFRKTNDELKSLLLFSFDRLMASNAKNNEGPVFR